MGQNSIKGATSVEAEELFQELNRSYRLKTVRLDLGKNQLRIIKVADLDELLEGVTDADQIPFWAELWPSSIGLAKYLF